MPTTTPSSTSQSVFALLRGILNVVVRTDDGVGGLEEQHRLLGKLRTRLARVVAIVEPDAEHLAGSRHARRPALGRIDDGQRRDAACEKLRKLRKPVALEEVAIPVAKYLGNVAPIAPNEHAGTLVTGSAEANQPHG